MATDFRTLIESLKDYGFFDIVLPFLLVFTLIFAILEKTKLLGLEGQNAKTNINAILSLVISFIFIANTDVSQVINSYISNVGLLIVIALIFVFAFCPSNPKSLVFSRIAKISVKTNKNGKTISKNP